MTRRREEDDEKKEMKKKYGTFDGRKRENTNQLLLLYSRYFSWHKSIDGVVFQLRIVKTEGKHGMTCIRWALIGFTMKIRIVFLLDRSLADVCLSSARRGKYVRCVHAFGLLVIQTSTYAHGIFRRNGTNCCQLTSSIRWAILQHLNVLFLFSSCSSANGTCDRTVWTRVTLTISVLCVCVICKYIVKTH